MIRQLSRSSTRLGTVTAPRIRHAQSMQLWRQLSTESPDNAPAKPAWKWVPPPMRPQQTLEEEATEQVQESLPKSELAKPIPVIAGVHLTAEEVIGAFLLNGAENVVQKPCGKLADAMVIATARSSLHARMLAELVVKSTKARRLKTYNPGKPIEGEEDWFLVDTGKLFVHVFGDEEIRRKVGLEAHLDNLADRTQALKDELSVEEIDDDNLIATSHGL